MEPRRPSDAGAIPSVGFRIGGRKGFSDDNQDGNGPNDGRPQQNTAITEPSELRTQKRRGRAPDLIGLAERIGGRSPAGPSRIGDQDGDQESARGLKDQGGCAAFLKLRHFHVQA